MEAADQVQLQLEMNDDGYTGVVKDFYSMGEIKHTHRILDIGLNKCARRGGCGSAASFQNKQTCWWHCIAIQLVRSSSIKVQLLQW